MEVTGFFIGINHYFCTSTMIEYNTAAEYNYLHCIDSKAGKLDSLHKSVATMVPILFIQDN